MRNNSIPKLALVVLLMLSCAAVDQPAPAFKSTSIVGVIRFHGEF